MLLAEGLDSLSGGSGWVGAGLLGLVLSWLLLKHLPDKDAQITALQSVKDKQLDAQRAEFAQNQTSALLAYQKDIAEQRSRSDEIARSGHDSVRALADSFHELALALSTDCGSASPSAIIRRRHEKQNSVLE